MRELPPVHVETFGCQMNKLDSELVLAALAAEGYSAADSPDRAGVILFNTCSVRQHAEERVYSRLADLRKRAEREPDLVVGVIGCMAQREAERIFERCPWVSVVAGPTHLDRVPDLVRQALAGRRRVQAVSADIRAAAGSWDPPRPRRGGAQRFVRIMHGCNNFCAYCIVPYVRGPEVSRPLEDVVEEVRHLADAGCREVTLLGQNVNSYRHDGARLPHLLERLNAVEGLLRIRFVTSHPRDLADDILDAMANLDKVCEHLHLPAQAGADSELARMNRNYTRAHYLGIVERARQRMPDIGLMSDFIVGFPGETADEFAATLSLVEAARYKNCFAFRYSPRPGTAAAGLTDDVPLATKQARLAELLAVQRRVAEADNRRFVGRQVEVLVEGPSKHARRARGGDERPLPVRETARDEQERAGVRVVAPPVVAPRPSPCPLPGGERGDQAVPASALDQQPRAGAAHPAPTRQLVGRTRSDHIVVFDGPLSLVGSLAAVRIHEATDLTLLGSFL